MPTLRVTLEYDGTGFRGWARQPGLRTVEGVLRQALDAVLPRWEGLAVAGRTDAGVHATGQVASLTAELDGTDLEVSYVPRHRFGTDDHPVRSVNWDGYRVSATDGANTETVDTLSEFHTFDVTGWATPITVSVSQLNRFTGEGPAVTEEVA